jgi:hypothetical protein
MKKYEIRHKVTNYKGYIWKEDSGYGMKYYVSWREDGSQYNYSDWEWRIDTFEKEWDIPKSVKFKLLWPGIVAKGLTILACLAVLGASIAAFMVIVCCTWDYHTGQDTGYISAVDKMTFSDDRKIYIRRRPLDAAGYGYAEKDETEYCTTADNQEVIDKAYEAMANGKRVILVYDKPREFGWRAIGHCNSAPITDIKYVDE